MGRIFVEYMLFHVANGEQYWSAILVTPVAGTINNRCKIITGHSLVTSWLERALNSRGFLRLDSTPRGFIVRWNGLLSPRGSHIVAFSPTRCDNENNASWNGEPTIVFFFSLSLSPSVGQRIERSSRSLKLLRLESKWPKRSISRDPLALVTVFSPFLLLLSSFSRPSYYFERKFICIYIRREIVVRRIFSLV